VLDRGPLIARHRARTRVGEEIDEHVLRAQGEDVVARLLDLLAALVLGGNAERFDGMDAEGLDDRLEAVGHCGRC
jgi:hypothetical protein